MMMMMMIQLINGSAVIAVLESGLLVESDIEAEALQFPAVDSLQGTSWQSVTDHVTLSRDTVVELTALQSRGLIGQSLISLFTYLHTICCRF